MTPKTQKVIERILTKLENGELSYEFKIDSLKTAINKTEIWFTRNTNLVSVNRIEISIDDRTLQERINAFLIKVWEIEKEKALDAVNKSLDSSLFAEVAQAVNEFGKKALATESIVNKLQEVDKKFEISANDLAEALTRVGDSAQKASVSMDYLIASIRAVEERTKLGGAAIGNVLNSIFKRLLWEGVQQDLEVIGVKSINCYTCCNERAIYEYRGAFNILRDFKIKSAILPEKHKLYLEEAISGIYGVNILRALLDSL